MFVLGKVVAVTVVECSSLVVLAVTGESCFVDDCDFAGVGE